MENNSKTEVVIVLPDKTRYTLITEPKVFTEENINNMQRDFAHAENMFVKVRPNGTQIDKWIVLWGAILKNSYLEITTFPD